MAQCQLTISLLAIAMTGDRLSERGKGKGREKVRVSQTAWILSESGCYGGRQSGTTDSPKLD